MVHVRPCYFRTNISVAKSDFKNITAYVANGIKNVFIIKELDNSSLFDVKPWKAKLKSNEN